MNKINRLVSSNFNDSFTDKWLSDDFQKKLKKVFKNKREKTATSDTEAKKHSPYIQFCMEERPEMKKSHPTMSAKEITAKLGEKWNDYKENDPEYLETKYGYVRKAK